MSENNKVLLTGGTGFIGRQIHAAFEGSRWSICNLGRSAPSPYTWALGEAPDSKVFRDVDVLIHAAFDTKLTAWHDIQRCNIEGTRLLLDAAASAGVVRIVLISSIAAFEGCQSDYGRAKLACEDFANRCGACVVRPGLVYGEQSGGVYAAMESWVQSLPVTPILVPSPNFYMCHVDDLCALISEIVNSTEWNPGVVTTAFPQPFDFREVVRVLQHRHGVRKPIVPVPWRLPWAACKALELLGLRPPFRSDGLVGLMKGNTNPDFSSLNHYQTDFRNFA